MSRIAVVTGAGTGIGRGIALALARRGIGVALAGRRLEPLAAVAAELKRIRPNLPVAALPADLADWRERRRLVEQVQRQLGSVSILVNNAAVLAGGELPALSAEEIASASAEQSTGIAQINQAMSQLNQATQQNASASEELAATAEEMGSQAEQLQGLMQFFRVDEGRHAPVYAPPAAPKANAARPAIPWEAGRQTRPRSQMCGRSWRVGRRTTTSLDHTAHSRIRRRQP